MRIEELYYDMPDQPTDDDALDLEEWRKKNPMDYFKAMYILEHANNLEEKYATFRAIYNIVRCHIPDVLYKYYSLSSDESKNMQKFQTLNDGEVFMSDIKDFNDPFDAKGFFYDHRELADIERLKEFDGRIVQDFTRYIKATSLTSNGVQSMPMWAHYASNHTGFCVSYDMNKNRELSCCTFPVQYTTERLDITSLMRKQALQICDEIDRQILMGENEIKIDNYSIIFATLLLCNLKHASWSYEKEFRCTTAASTVNGPYTKATPKEIYIGMNCKPDHEQRLIEIATSRGVPVYKMAFDELSNKYELIARPY